MSSPDAYESELSAYLDGELDAAARVELERRLEESPQLRERLAQLRAADAALVGLPASEPSAALLAQIRARMTDAEAGEGSRAVAHRRGFGRRSFGIAMTCAAAASLAVVLWWPRPADDARQDIARTETLVPRTEPLVPASAQVAQIEEEFGFLLVPEEPADRSEGAPLAEPAAGSSDLAVIEVLEFLEDLGDLSEAGRG